MSSSSFSLPRSTPHRRPVQSTIPTDPIRTAVDQAPNERRGPAISQLLAFGLIIFLGLLQFLPATHFRDASDPFRKWVPFPSNLSSSSSSNCRPSFIPYTIYILQSSKYTASSDENSGYSRTRTVADRMVHIVSWIDCLDLRVLAVLMNSTLSCARYPELVSFHFFTPEGHNNGKVSYYKLKVLFPHSKLEIIGQEKVKELIMTAYSAGEYRPPFDEMVPFAIPAVLPTVSKFIYVSPNVIIKGGVEELLGDLKNFGIAVAEDCTKQLSAYINFDILDAIQRSSAKPWLSGTPYSKDACMPDLGLVVIDSTRLQKDLLEAILWWSRVLNKSERESPSPAVALALYNRHLKLDISQDTLISRYDWGRNLNSESCDGAVRTPALENLWKQYLPLMPDQFLGN
ncbi:hypothetical protein RHSIM_Rhsim13G0127600 [Rhododendron simsii]|uniref:Hexosyltransferase n=1 Tax=Rhododendron simsii TaxID=118357 RepID=A0A834FY09_RHOSS|nr:hypothetical protein RHSIM_Rhsim13G0127600 [Rhododendron simsii]